MRGLSCRLLHFDFKCSCILDPAALRKPFLQVGNSRERGVSLAEFVFCIRLPIESSVRLRPVQRGKLAEFLGGAVVAVFVQSFAAVAVELIEPLEPFLLAVALFLFTVAGFFFAVAFLLLAIPRCLFPVRAALFLPGFRGRSDVGCRGLCHPWRDQ